MSSRRLCQEDGCNNELSPNAMEHRKFCDPCNMIKRRKRIAVSIAKRKQREQIIAY